MKATLVCYDTVHMPIKFVMNRTHFLSSMYSEDVRRIAEDMRSLYLNNSMMVPDQYVHVVFYRDATPEDRTDDPAVQIAHRILTETACISSFDVAKQLEDIPPGSQWVSVFDWKNAILTCLHFRVEP